MELLLINYPRNIEHAHSNKQQQSTDPPPPWTPAGVTPGVTPGAAAPPIPPSGDEVLPPAWTPPEPTAVAAPIPPPLPVLQGRTTSTETVPETPQGEEPE